MSPPNFSAIAPASTIASMPSAMTPIAGTAVTSERSDWAFAAAPVFVAPVVVAVPVVPAAPVVASEFCGTSITSQARAQKYLDAAREDNPHIKLAEGRYRGYVRVEVERGKLKADLRAMETVTERDAACSTLAGFVVEDGRPGPQRV